MFCSSTVSTNIPITYKLQAICFIWKPQNKKVKRENIRKEEEQKFERGN